MKEGGLTDGGGAPSDAFTASAAVEASSSTSQRRLHRTESAPTLSPRPSVRPSVAIPVVHLSSSSSVYEREDGRRGEEVEEEEGEQTGASAAE